eukprot:SAG31_NODE_1513_length_8045_cov_5.748804_5_plen_408_part_00
MRGLGLPQVSSYSAVLPLFAASLAGGSKAVAGYAVGLRPLASMLLQLPAGRIYNYLGPRTTLAAALCIDAVAALGAAMAGRARSFWLFFMATGCGGLGQALWTVGRLAFMRMSIRPRVRGRAIAVWGGVGRLAGVVGPILGGWAAARAGSASVFVLQAAVAAVGALSILATHSDSGKGSAGALTPPYTAAGPPVKQGSASTSIGVDSGLWSTWCRHWQTYATVGSALCLVNLARAAKFVLVPLLGKELGLDVGQISAIFATANSVEAPFFLPAGLAYDRFGMRQVAIVTSAATAACWMWTGTRLRRPAGLLAVCCGLGLTNGMTSGIGTLTTQMYAPGDASDAQYFALFGILTDAAQMAGPMLVGAIAQKTSTSTATNVTAAVSLRQASSLRHVQLCYAALNVIGLV